MKKAKTGCRGEIPTAGCERTQAEPQYKSIDNKLKTCIRRSRFDRRSDDKPQSECRSSSRSDTSHSCPNPMKVDARSFAKIALTDGGI